MVNKAGASITRSREEPDLKRPMIPLGFLSKPADHTWLSSITSRAGEGWFWNSAGLVQVDAPPLYPYALCGPGPLVPYL